VELYIVVMMGGFLECASLHLSFLLAFSFFVRIVEVLHLLRIHCVMPVFSPLYPPAAAEYGCSHGMII
jgi:hypothetical protein